MVQFSEPLYKATLLICGSTYPTINQELPLYILLIEAIRQVSEQYDVTPIEPAAQATIQKISKYISIVLRKSPVICASILDPRIKQVFFATHESTLVEFHTSSLQLSKVFEDKAKKYVNNDDSQPHVNIKKTRGLLDKMYPSSSGEGCSFEKELQWYFAEPPEPKDTDILIFWKSQGKLFPTLALMGHNYLAIPATSAPSECVFSGGRKILTYQQYSLTPMHVKQLACVKDWACTFGLLFYES
ncbi:hypothetical protein O181_004660 [Austropuccinia psidii MF-1]|uniref:HAT C-terminal dimerisation domain-containing protein n=1 Tax=Austropuccinia psidii MF-1 TaxID=1389203 RepID=A0A9Q3BGV2_9BASI|nr:hypothetical protein [Austropuccinia psidii MF-1]